MALVVGGTLAYLFLPFPWWILVVVGLAGVEIFEISLWLWLRGRRSVSGPEGMIGERGVLTATGRVRIRGTTYPSRGVDGDDGDRVIVEDVEGMMLVVRRAEEREP